MRATRHRNLARLVSGLYQAQHVHLSKVADELPGRARQTSKTRRLSLPVGRLTSGSYFVRVRGDDFITTRRVTVVR